jgi:hypothetical protein
MRRLSKSGDWLVAGNAHTGALQLVPPIWVALPWKTRKAPVFGSAARLTSGTSRCVPLGIPAPVCQGGRWNRMLFPPPLPLQPVSLLTLPSAPSRRVVPPTPTTLESDDSYSACRGPVELWPVPSGFEPASPLETNTFTPAAASLRKRPCCAATSSLAMKVSPRPKLMESCRMLGWVGRSAMMRSRARSRSTKLSEPLA